MDPEQRLGDGAFSNDFPAAAIDTLVASAGPTVDPRFQGVEIRHLGGALACHPDHHGAQTKIDAKYLMFAAGAAPMPDQGDAARTHTRALRRFAPVVGRL
jgi:hypothetical protein